MSSLPSGVRRVYNFLYKRKATGGNSYTPTPTQIKEYFESQDFNFDSITDEEFNQAINYFSSNESSLGLQHNIALSLNQSGEQNENGNYLSELVPPDITTLTKQQKHDIVLTKASEMSIQLSAADIAYVADRIDVQVGETLDDILSQTENLLCEYADYKKHEGIQKIDAMFVRVYDHVQLNNSETSHHISSRLQQFGHDVEQGQQDFKSSVLNALERLKVPGASA